MTDRDSSAEATPLTDEEVEIAKKFPATSHGLWVSAEFARHLERALGRANRELASARREARRDAMEEAARICESWPLSPQNMDRVSQWRGDWPNKVAGVCRSELPKAIRAAIDAAKGGERG